MDIKQKNRATKNEVDSHTVDKTDIDDFLSNNFESVFVKEPMGPLQLEKRTDVSFGFERLLNKIHEYDIEKT